MNIRDQLRVLQAHAGDFVVVGGQAGVLRQAIEFSHDLDVLIGATQENAARIAAAVRDIVNIEADPATLLGRDFQQYIDPESGTEIDVHLKLIALPDFAAAKANASAVDFLGVVVDVLELTALYATKRTDRPRDAVHRLAIEARLRALVRQGLARIDDCVLACCLDGDIARLPRVAELLASRAAQSDQPLLQTRIAALSLYTDELLSNPRLGATPKALLALDATSRAKLIGHPARLAALLSRIPLILPAEGHHVAPVRTS